MYDDDYIDWEEEKLDARAVKALIYEHREEYDELTGRFHRERVEKLERTIRTLQDQLKTLKGLNPEGVNVPALTQTVNGLAEENAALRKTKRSRVSIKR